MRTKEAIFCDYSQCLTKVILTKGDHLIVGNCNYHVVCWSFLSGKPNSTFELPGNEGGAHA